MNQWKAAVTSVLKKTHRRDHRGDARALPAEEVAQPHGLDPDVLWSETSGMNVRKFVLK